jgi:hypothetical protein
MKAADAGLRLRHSHCYDCPYKGLKAEEAKELMDGYPFGDAEKAFPCHIDGLMSGTPNLCRGWHHLTTLARVSAAARARRARARASGGRRA